VKTLVETHARGSEVLLHGLVHRADEAVPARLGPVERAKARWLTAGEGEFQTLRFEEARRRLERGRDVLERVLGTRPRGFIAPAWLEHIDTERALASLGFELHEDHLFLRHIARGRRALVPALTFSARTRLRLRLSLGWARLMELVARTPLDVRLALHPLDFGSTELVTAIGRLATAVGARRRWATYAEVLDQ
jgi:predicted deacetylase